MLQVTKLSNGAATPSRRVAGRKIGVWVEPLESRTLLTAVLVNTSIDQHFLPQSGYVSLRDAIATANASTTPTTISFDPAYFNTSRQIIFSLQESLSSSQPITITGPDAELDLEVPGNVPILSITSGQVSISNLTFYGGASGIANSGTTTLTNVVLRNSLLGVSNSGTLTVNQCYIHDNLSGTSGGGLSNAAGAKMTLNGTNIQNNYAPSAGGIYNAGTLTLNSSQVVGNIGTSSTSTGGGILNAGGTLTLNSSLIYNNQAVTGAGIDNEQGTIYCDNDTISNNTASGNGGGIANGDTSFPNGGVITLANCTIVHNTAALGGGLIRATGCMTFIANTIIALNKQAVTSPVGPDVYEQQTSRGNNLIGIKDGSKDWLSTDLTGTAGSPLDPKLTPFDYFGGPTDSYVPLLGSPAIDAGSNRFAVDANNAALKNDQRGLARRSNTIVDIGATEFQPIHIRVPAGTDQLIFYYDSGTNWIEWSAGAAAGSYSELDNEPLVIDSNGDNDFIAFSVSAGHMPGNLRLNGTFTLSSLDFVNGALRGCNLDIGASTIYIFYGDQSSSPLPLVQQYLKTGYNFGAWNGTSPNGDIFSSAAAANANLTTAIGYADSADGLVPLPPATIELKYTLYGDTGLTGTVGFTDFMRMTQNYGTSSGASWRQGDFNYDGAVTSIDFNVLKPNYGQTLPAAVPASEPNVVPVMTPIAVAPVTTAPSSPSTPATSVIDDESIVLAGSTDKHKRNATKAHKKGH